MDSFQIAYTLAAKGIIYSVSRCKAVDEAGRGVARYSVHFGMWALHRGINRHLFFGRQPSVLFLFLNYPPEVLFGISKMSRPEFTLRTGIYPAIEPELFKSSLTDKVALVTGSGRGIGREIALALAKSSAAVAVTGRTKSQVEETTQDVLKLGGKAIGVVADVCSKEDLERLVNEVNAVDCCLLNPIADLSFLGHRNPWAY
jgi:hypothetical protein